MKMDKKIFDRVTITGIDDNTDYSVLQDYSKKYPWLEWGVLISKSRLGSSRFPSFNGIDEILDLNLNLSSHICGIWMRNICKGDWKILELFNFKNFNRIQLNLSREIDRIDKDRFINGLKKIKFNGQIIMQSKDINHPLIIASSRTHNILPLFDISGGRGIKPSEWPVYFSLNGCGFSGGLTPENIEEELQKISSYVPDFVWVDIESGVRTGNEFDFQKVDRFLKIVNPWVK